MKKPKAKSDSFVHFTETKRALSKLDDIATSPCMMGADDIESLSEAREILGELLGLTYNKETERYT